MHNCRCWLDTLAERDLAKLGIDPDSLQAPTAPDDLTGIDKGWGYAPGANAQTPLRELIDRKLFSLEAPIGAALWEGLKETLAAEELRRAVAAMVDRVAAHKESNGESLLVTAVSAATLADLALTHRISLESAGVWLRDRELLHALRDTKDAAGHALPASVWRDLPRLLEQATPYLDTVDSALVYAFDLPDGTGKVVVRINYGEKVRQDGQRARITANFIRTGGVVEAHNMEEARYVRLEK